MGRVERLHPAPPASTRWSTDRAGDSLRSSVPALNVSPQAATVAPFEATSRGRFDLISNHLELEHRWPPPPARKQREVVGRDRRR